VPLAAGLVTALLSYLKSNPWVPADPGIVPIWAIECRSRRLMKDEILR
jgi:hypothetical protein